MVFRDNEVGGMNAGAAVPGRDNGRSSLALAPKSFEAGNDDSVLARARAATIDDVGGGKESGFRLRSER